MQSTTNLETACFICAEEMIWAGDRGTADALKSLITGDSLTLEVKNGARWEIPNRLHFVMTTNHDHAVHAGAHDRRFFVLDVDPVKAQNSDWFGPLYRDLDDGGRAEFLYFLQNLNLGDWHPLAGNGDTSFPTQTSGKNCSMLDWESRRRDRRSYQNNVVVCPGVSGMWPTSTRS